MDSIRGMVGGANSNTEQQPSSNDGGFMGKMNSAMGGGQSGEKNEDMLDKGEAALLSFQDFD